MKKYSQLFILILVFSILQVSLVSAAGIGDVFDSMGRTFASITQNTNFMFLIVFILMFMILYAVFSAGISKVGVFSGSNGVPNRNGKIVAVCFGLLGALGIAYWVNYSPAKFIENILSWAGVYGAAMFGFLIYGITYMNWKNSDGSNNKFAAACATGFAFLAYGALLDDKGPGATSLKSIGTLILFICLIWWLIQLIGGGKKEEGGNNSDGTPNKNPEPNKDPNKNPEPETKEEDDPNKKTDLVPSQVKNVNANVQPDGKVRITWDANPKEESITHYNVYRKQKDASQGIGTIPNSEGNNLNVIDQELENNIEYVYEVYAYNKFGFSKAGSVKFTRETFTMKGRLVYGNDEQQFPIQGLTLGYFKVINNEPSKVEGSYAGAKFETNEKGEFQLTNIIKGTGLYYLQISDSYNVYKGIFYPNIINADSEEHDLKDIFIEPAQAPAEVIFENQTNEKIKVIGACSAPTAQNSITPNNPSQIVKPRDRIGFRFIAGHAYTFKAIGMHTGNEYITEWNRYFVRLSERKSQIIKS